MKFGKMSIKSDADIRKCVVELEIGMDDLNVMTFSITGVPSGVAAEMLVRWNTYQDLKDELNSLKGNNDGAIQ